MTPKERDLRNLLQGEPKLKPAFKKLWLEALRSGEYEQGRTVLCSEDGRWCCLGVAADVETDAFWELTDFCYYWVLVSARRAAVSFREGHDLPEVVMEKMGLSVEAEAALITGNDNGLTFEQIANAIEACL